MTMMAEPALKVLLATTTRADYAACAAVCRSMASSSRMAGEVLVAGAHLSPAFGLTIREIERDGWTIADRIDCLLASDTPESLTKSVGLAVMGMASTMARVRPDFVLVFGDRLEMLAPALAALAARIPIGHVGGGDISEGSLDHQIRFVLSRMSHVHFVAMQEHADRLIATGEKPERIFVTGDPALDEIGATPRKSRDEIAAVLGTKLIDPVVAVTMHPNTVENVGSREMDAVLDALDDWPGTAVITYPGADAGWHALATAAESFASTHARAVAVPSLGRQNYYSLLDLAAVMVGNTSSGIWESPSFRLPVVNVGDRQKGRFRAANVVDAVPDASSIRRAIDAALTPEFRTSLASLTNPYGDGRAADRIVTHLANLALTPQLFRKPA